MKIMCDTNIILDVLLERQPFVEDSYKVLSLCEEHRLEGFVSASSVTDIYYLVRKYTHSISPSKCLRFLYQSINARTPRFHRDS